MYTLIAYRSYIYISILTHTHTHIHLTVINSTCENLNPFFRILNQTLFSEYHFLVLEIPKNKSNNMIATLSIALLLLFYPKSRSV